MLGDNQAGGILMRDQRLPVGIGQMGSIGNGDKNSTGADHRKEYGPWQGAFGVVRLFGHGRDGIKTKEG